MSLLNFLRNIFTAKSTNSGLKKVGYINPPLLDFVVLDLETTGLNPHRDHIVQVAVVRFAGGEEMDHFCTLVKPPYSIPSRATEIHGITDHDVIYSPDIRSIQQELRSFIGSSIVAGYNINFDIGFLQAVYGPGFLREIETFDVLSTMKKFVPGLSSYKLSDMAWIVGHQGKSHDALSDCRMTANLITFLSEPIDDTTITRTKDGSIPKTNSSDSPAKVLAESPFSGKRVLISGTLSSYKRDELSSIIESLGGTVAINLTQSVKYVIVGDNPGVKYERAKALQAEGCDIQFLTESELISIISKSTN